MSYSFEYMTPRVSKVISVAYSLLAVALLSSCRRESADPVPTGVARVGDRVITAEQLQKRLAERLRRKAPVQLTAADRDTALDELVQFEVLWAQAQRAGWHTNAELLDGFKRTVVARFKEQEMTVRTSAKPTSEEVADYYSRNSSQFTRPEHVRGAVILLEVSAKATPEKRAEALARGAELRDRAVKDAADPARFGSLAQQHSVDQATRYAGGEFGLLPLSGVSGRYGPELAHALASLRSPGEISPVVETPRGLGFVKLIERQAESRIPLDQVRDRILFQLSKAKQAQAETNFLAEVRRGVDVQLNHAAIEHVPLPIQNDEPPVSPAGGATQSNLPRAP